MISNELKTAIARSQRNVKNLPVGVPEYNPDTHIKELATNNYYKNLIFLRDLVKRACDDFMGNRLKAVNVDLFMLTTSVSSPMGPGSDSEPLPIKFGKNKAYLTDSSQFGFEPLLMNGFKAVYCYLPSMRGENPDARHLNQFFHCEAEISGTLEDMMLVVENYVRHLAETLLLSNKLIKNISANPLASKKALLQLAASKILKRITFDEACDLLEKSGSNDCINVTSHGRDINSKGEQKILEILGGTDPIWIMHFDRDRVPFYQKPNPSDKTKVLCADLIFPALIEGSFGGEIVGAGQRQDTVKEMHESLRRQNISSDAYEWYINLRRSNAYSVTSGFGLGIERFIAWSLCLPAIRDAIIYPREKNILAKP